MLSPVTTLPERDYTMHAVVSDQRIVWITPDRQLHSRGLARPISHISQLWHIGQALAITDFWIMPGCAIDLAGYDFLTPCEGYNIFVPLASDDNRPDEPRSARCWQESAGRRSTIYIAYPGRDPWSWSADTPLDILACVDYLRQVLPSGLAVRWSPATIGESLLKQKYSATDRLKSYIRPASVDLKALPFRQAAKDIAWLARFAPAMSGRYLHLYDKNSAHPTAAASVKTGCGDPVHLTVACTEHARPGIYRVSFNVRDSRFDGSILPQIVRGEWVTLDILKFAVEYGYDVIVHEAYVFEEGRVLFGDWMRDLWQARQQLKDTARFPYVQALENAQYSAKNIMNFTISSLRPNWWADMVGFARAAQLANLAKWADKGYFPVVVDHDTVGFVSEERDAALAVPGILDRQNKPGGYKHVCSRCVTDEMIKFANSLQTHQSAKFVGYVKGTR